MPIKGDCFWRMCLHWSIKTDLLSDWCCSTLPTLSLCNLQTLRKVVPSLTTYRHLCEKELLPGTEYEEAFWLEQLGLAAFLSRPCRGESGIGVVCLWKLKGYCSLCFMEGRSFWLQGNPPCPGHSQWWGVCVCVCMCIPLLICSMVAWCLEGKSSQDSLLKQKGGTNQSVFLSRNLPETIS